MAGFSAWDLSASLTGERIRINYTSAEGLPEPHRNIRGGQPIPRLVHLYVEPIAHRIAHADAGVLQAALIDRRVDVEHPHAKDIGAVRNGLYSEIRIGLERREHSRGGLHATAKSLLEA